MFDSRQLSFLPNSNTQNDLMNESAALTYHRGNRGVTSATEAYAPSPTSNWRLDDYSGSNSDRTNFGTVASSRLDESNYKAAFNNTLSYYMTSFLVGLNDVEHHERLHGQLTTTGRAGLFLPNTSTSAAFIANTTTHLSFSTAAGMDSASDSTSVIRAVIPNTTSEPGGVSAEFPGKNIIIPLYTLIFFLSFVGNLFVILTLARSPRMRNVTNVFLLNLAIADLLLGVMCMPVTLIGQLLRHFIFGEFMCKIIPYFQAISISVGVWTLVAISLERYFAICRPLQSRKWQTTSHAYKMIAGVWIATILWNLPITIVSELQPVLNNQNHTTGRFRCRENWPNPNSEKVFNLALGFILLLTPLCIMGLAYSLIATKLWKGLKSELRHTKSFHHSQSGILPSEHSMELSTHSHYSTCNKHLNNSTAGHSTVEQSGAIRKSTSRDFVPNEIVTLRGGKGVVVRWKRKDAIEVADAGEGTKKSAELCPKGAAHHHHHLVVANKNGGGNRDLLKASRALNFSRAIRSTYTGKSIESKKKVIRMLFVLVLEFFLTWAPLYVMHTWWLFDSKAVYELLSPLGVSLIQLLAYVSSCCNPVTYCFMNRKFRLAFLKLFKCMMPFGRKPGPPTIGRGSDLSANDSLVFGIHGTTMNKSVVVLECEERV